MFPWSTHRLTGSALLLVAAVIAGCTAEQVYTSKDLDALPCEQDRRWFYPIEFDIRGKAIYGDQLNTLEQALKEERVTDLVVFVHGWGKTAQSAERDYQDFICRFYRKIALASLDREQKIVVVGIFWPSTISSDPSLLGSLFELRSYYRMRNRADLIASTGFVDILKVLRRPALQQKLANQRLHLIGHSFGARVVLKGLAHFIADKSTFAFAFLRQLQRVNIVLINAALPTDVFQEQKIELKYEPSEDSPVYKEGITCPTPNGSMTSWHMLLSPILVISDLIDLMRVSNVQVFNIFSQNDQATNIPFQIASLLPGSDSATCGIGHCGIPEGTMVNVTADGDLLTGFDRDENHIWNIDATPVISSHVDIYKGRVSTILARLFSFQPDRGKAGIRSQAAHHVVEGIGLIENASWEQAETEFAQAAKLEEERPLWHFLLGLTVAQRCQWEASESHITKAIQLAAAQVGRPAWERVPIGELLHWRLVLGNVLYFEKKWLPAEKVLREIVEIEPHYPLVPLMLGPVLEAQNKWSEAESLYRPLAESKGGSVFWFKQLVHVLEKQGKWSLVEEEIKKGIERGLGQEIKYNEELMITLGEALKAQNKVEEARRVLEQTTAPEFRRDVMSAFRSGEISEWGRDGISENHGHLRLAEIYLKEKNWRKVEEHCTQIIKWGLTPYPALIMRGRAFLEQQRLTEAKTDLESALNLANGYAPHYLLGVVLAEQQNWSAAAEQFRMALTFNPKDTEGSLGLANALWAQGFQDAAIQEIRKALAGNPNAWLFYALGKFLQAQGNLPDAKEQFQSAIKADPNEPIFRKALDSVTTEQQK